MLCSIKHPESFIIKENNNREAFGGNQAWYPKYWARQSGCGPTSAANIMAYLAETEQNMQRFMSKKADRRSTMSDLWKNCLIMSSPAPWV
jgi:hypothetical protein